MTKKNTSSYICNNCLMTFSQWSGKCPNCAEWNSLEIQDNVTKTTKTNGTILQPAKMFSLTTESTRYKVGFSEIDKLLGGGIVPGSVNLITGQPGIGKSTLLLQLAEYIATKYRVIYVSGEESINQVSQRAHRLGFKDSQLLIINSYSADDIVASINTDNYDLMIIDSIQTISCSWINSTAGSVSQITNSTQEIIAAAKETNTAILMVGHVTKDGSIAGPKILEHMVDVVLQLEGDRYGGFKLLKSTKNRFGSTNEVAIFEMNALGFKIIKNPSFVLLEERMNIDGSIVTATMEGTRPILVEVQALVTTTNFGYPKRTASGFDINRLNLLIAVLEQRAKLKLSSKDIYINVVGGISLTEPASDLAISLAIASALNGKQLTENLVVFGEVGLAGEIRHVPFIENRLKEAQTLNFNGVISPRVRSFQGQGLNQVRSVNEAIEKFL